MYTNAMNTLLNEPLASYTSLRVGGAAEELVVVETYDNMTSALVGSKTQPWILGFGCNVLISDNGLPGRTIIWRGGRIEVKDRELTAEAGVWWDDVVKRAIAAELWGLELMSEIPSSVGGAVFGNIAAYGQQVSDTLAWLDVFNLNTARVERYAKSGFEFSYRWSSLQNNPHLIILRAGFTLSPTPLHELQYDAALAVAHEFGLDQSSLEQRRKAIIETRRRAGSLYHPDEPKSEHTAGSFFKNPIVSTEQARELAKFDETGKTLERIESQSRIHGGDSHRSSAAHVLLAAGFSRGQTWGHIRLHPQHVLKLEALPGATAAEVYEVVQTIVHAVKAKLDIELIPEVRFLGNF